MPDTPRGDAGAYHIVRALQREAGGGVAKAVNITVFFDDKGRIIGRSECETVKLFPGGDVSKLVSLLFGK